MTTRSRLTASRETRRALPAALCLAVSVSSIGTARAQQNTGGQNTRGQSTAPYPASVAPIS